MSGALDQIVTDAMESLAPQRPILHSEADFQLALPWQIQQQHPRARMRLEKRVLEKPRVTLDILVAVGDLTFAVELKYPRTSLDATVDGERFILIAGAPDLDRYDFLKDIARIERLVREGVCDAYRTCKAGAKKKARQEAQEVLGSGVVRLRARGRGDRRRALPPRELLRRLRAERRSSAHPRARPPRH